MGNYIDTKIETAGPDHLGVMNDHVAILPDYVNSHSAIPKVYFVIVRKDFNPAKGPELVRDDVIHDGFYFMNFDFRPKAECRGWQNIADVCENVSLEDAIRRGRETAKKENIALYLPRVVCESVIDWHPEGWEPHRG
ncbi:hypothetical protein HYV87_03110 [Candidatus Woesearchaeota archaeon]|nr:hypothetical protein [Candidatus Woesearchaeota archaeon]